MKLKEIHNHGSQYISVNDVELSANDNVENYLSKAAILPQTSKELFKKNGKPNLCRSGMCILKISYTKGDKTVSIWRECSTKVISGMEKDVIGLPFNAMLELGITKAEKENGVQLEVKKGCVIPFLFKHPNTVARATSWMGALGIVVSIVLAVVFNCF